MRCLLLFVQKWSHTTLSKQHMSLTGEVLVHAAEFSVILILIKFCYLLEQDSKAHPTSACKNDHWKVKSYLIRDYTKGFSYPTISTYFFLFAKSLIPIAQMPNVTLPKELLFKSILSTTRTSRSCSCFNNSLNVKYSPVRLFQWSLFHSLQRSFKKRKLITSLPHVIQGLLNRGWSVHHWRLRRQMEEASTK